MLSLSSSLEFGSKFKYSCICSNAKDACIEDLNVS